MTEEQQAQAVERAIRNETTCWLCGKIIPMTGLFTYKSLDGRVSYFCCIGHAYTWSNRNDRTATS